NVSGGIAFGSGNFAGSRSRSTRQIGCNDEADAGRRSFTSRKRILVEIGTRIGSSDRMKPIFAMGIMSGTSLDGLDAVLLRVQSRSGGYRVERIAHRHVRFPSAWPKLARKIAEENLLRESAQYGAAWSELAATLVRSLARQGEISMKSLSVIG